MGSNNPYGFKLYNFVDNHDVERIYTKLNNKAHFTPVHILLYTLPGIPSLYYGSEFGIEGRKEKFSDASLRPALNLEEYKNALTDNSFTALIAALGRARQHSKALSYGDYRELKLMNRQYAFSRNFEGESVVVTVNNDDSDFTMTLPAGNVAEYIGALSGQKIRVENGNICVNVKANSGDIWLPVTNSTCEKQPVITPVELHVEDATKTALQDNTTVQKAPDTVVTPVAPPQTTPVNVVNTDEKTTAISEDFEKGKIAGLQEAILAIMEKNGPVTDQMRKDVKDNIYHDSLINWIKSFR